MIVCARPPLTDMLAVTSAVRATSLRLADRCSPFRNLGSYSRSAAACHRIPWFATSVAVRKGQVAGPAFESGPLGHTRYICTHAYIKDAREGNHSRRFEDRRLSTIHGCRLRSRGPYGAHFGLHGPDLKTLVQKRLKRSICLRYDGQAGCERRHLGSFFGRITARTATQTRGRPWAVAAKNFRAWFCSSEWIHLR